MGATIAANHYPTMSYDASQFLTKFLPKRARSEAKTLRKRLQCCFSNPVFFLCPFLGLLRAAFCSVFLLLSQLKASWWEMCFYLLYVAKAWRFNFWFGLKPQNLTLTWFGMHSATAHLHCSNHNPSSQAATSYVAPACRIKLLCLCVQRAVGLHM